METTQTAPRPQIIVAQLGARMHYGRPVLLHRAGLLGHFFTDAYVGPGSTWHLISKVAPLIPSAWQPPALKRLLGRRENSLPADKVTAFNLFGYSYAYKLRQVNSDRERVNIYIWAAKKFNQKILESKTKIGGVGGIYSFNGISLELFSQLASPQTKKILEQIDASIVDGRLVAEESGRWPDWEYEPARIYEDEMFEREKLEWKMADLIITNSEFTKNAIISLGADSAKIKINPLGIDLSRFYPPEGKRIAPQSKINFLFLGTLSLRKGIQYALEAFRLIKSPNVSLTVAGGCDVKFRREKLLDYSGFCRYLGHIPRKEVVSVYHSADVFLFPTISDGFGLTQIEALACGLPVITTPNAGSVVRDGVDGFIVPIRDSGALAERIDLLASDPNLLAWMSRNARERAQEFSWEKFGERLIATLKPLFSFGE